MTDNTFRELNIILKRVKDDLLMINKRSGFGSVSILVQNGKIQILETTIKQKEFLKEEINTN